MGDQVLDTEANAQSSYSVIAFQGAKLPEGYRNVVLSNWLRSLRQGNDYFKLVEPKSYYEAYERYVKHIIQRPDTLLRMAVLSDDHDVVLGWSCMERKVLHYVFVRSEQRAKGVGQALTASGFEVITHITRAGIQIWNEKYKQVTFNPF